jgi:hypothetical protein
MMNFEKKFSVNSDLVLATISRIEGLGSCILLHISARLALAFSEN